MAEATFNTGAIRIFCPMCNDPLNWLTEATAQCENQDCPAYNERKVVELPKIQVTLK